MKSRKQIFLTLLFAGWMFGVAGMQAINSATLPDRAASIERAINQ